MRCAYCFLVLSFLCAIQAEAQRREIGNSGHGGSLPPPGHTERPVRSEPPRDDTRPPVPDPVPLPVVVENAVNVSQVVIFAPAPETRWLKDEPIEQTVLYDCNSQTSKSGFDFSSGEVVSCADQEVDLYFVVDEEGPEFVVKEDTDIQDAGENGGLSVAATSVSARWSPTHRVPVQPDNRYVVWTWDNQYYALRVTALAEDRVAFEWERVSRGARVAANIAYRNGAHHREQQAKFGR